MKKFVLAAVAATLVATPALAAAPQQYGHHAPAAQQSGSGGWQPGRQGAVHQPVYRPAPAPQYHSWKKGQRFDSRYARNYRQVDYRGYHGRLRAPPRGYRYVQSGNDIVMVSLVGGIIGAVFANLAR
jgi:Ni/Co efflux regulator RcnB